MSDTNLTQYATTFVMLLDFSSDREDEMDCAYSETEIKDKLTY